MVPDLSYKAKKNTNVTESTKCVHSSRAPTSVLKFPSTLEIEGMFHSWKVAIYVHQNSTNH